MGNNLENFEQLSPLQRAAFALQEMRTKLDAIEHQQTEPIAIVGIGCRFPGDANTPESFWQLLQNGVDSVTEVPSSRWNANAYYDANPEVAGKTYTKQGGFLGAIDGFDAEFFGLTPREVASMDPQQRLLLEVSWESLENASIAPDTLNGTQGGVFIGISVNEYAEGSLLGDASELDVYSATGNALSVAAGRLSYTLGLQGPSLVVDTACSSSLVAIHLACQSLRAKECNLALTGGAYLMLSPQTTIAMSKMRALSPDGRCKTFDAAADGYGRGEGCGMVVLKRLSDAIAERDNILALIRGSAINQDGSSSGLTVPNGLAQQQVIQAALTNARVEPAQIGYVEAHGTGTSLGDPVEVKSLGKVIAKHQLRQSPLLIGSVKTNIGHLEAAAGIAGLIKVVLAMQHQEIPPHLHFHTLNPHIAEAQLPVKIPTERTPWPKTETEKHFAGVSSFGFSGTNAHVVLEAAPVNQLPDASWERPLQLLTLSAKTETALKELSKRYQYYLTQHPSVSFADVCLSANTGRSHFNHRLAIVAASPQEAIEQLATFSTKSGIKATGTEQLKTVFFFSGELCQSLEIGQELYHSHPLFRQTIERCDELLQPYLNQSLVSVLYPESSLSSSLSDKGVLQLAMFVVEYALAQLWQSWGIEPDSVMGYGIGQCVAACVADVLSLEESLKLLMQSRDSNFEQFIGQVSFLEPQVDVLSVKTGQLLGKDYFTNPTLWCHPNTDLDQSLTGIQTLQEYGYEVLIEIGADSPLIEQIQQALPANNDSGLSLLKNQQADWQELLDCLSVLYSKGFTINWHEFERPYQRQRLALPTYPFERQRYWLENEKPQTSFSSRLVEQKSMHPLLGQRLPSPLKQIQFESQFDLTSLPLVKDHRLNGFPVVNLVLYLEMALAGAQEIWGKPVEHIEDLTIPIALILPEGESQTVQLVITPEEYDVAVFEVFSLAQDEGTSSLTWKLHAKGKLRLDAIENAPSNQLTPALEAMQARCQKKISSTQFYQLVEKRGAYLGPSCQGLQQVWQGEREALGQITANLESQRSDSNYQLPLGAIDSCFQILGAANSVQNDQSYLLLGLKSFHYYGSSSQPLWSQAQIQINSDEEEHSIITGDVVLFDDTGQVLLEIKQAKLKPVNYQQLGFNSQRNEPTLGSIKGSMRKNRLSKEQLLVASSVERQQLLETYLIETLAHSLQLPVSKFSPEQSLVEKVDSLMAFELKNRIETDLQLVVALEQFFGDNTIAQLAERLLEQLAADSLILTDTSPSNPEDMEEILL